MVQSVHLKKGFTLVEMVMVLVIIGLLASIVVPQFSLQMEEAREAQTRANLENLRSAIAVYVRKMGTNPNSLTDLTVINLPQISAPIIKSVPNDGWGIPFTYVKADATVMCSSANGKCSQEW